MAFPFCGEDHLLFDYSLIPVPSKEGTYPF